MKTNRVVFKLKSFPEISETFVISNIVEAIKQDFDVKIISDIVKSQTNTSQLELLKKYKILEKTKYFNQPKKKAKRYFKVLQYLCNPILFYYFIKYINIERKFSLGYLFILHFYLNYRNVKVFHIHFATAINPLLELKRIGFLKSKIIVTFHGYDAHFLHEGKRLKELILNFNSYVNQITVNSTYLKNKLIVKGFSENLIKIVPIGYNEGVFNNDIEKNISETPLKLISVGRLVTLKGHDLGIKAIKILKDKGYHVEYNIIGAGVEYGNLKALIDKLGLGNEVKLLEAKSQLEIKKLFRNSHLFLMTSTKDENERSEAFGVVSLEAQAMGLPIIGFNSGGFPDTMIDGKTGFLVEDKNVEEMVNKTEKLINNNDLLRVMSKHAENNIIKNFNSKNTTGRYLELYKTLIINS